MMDQIQLLEVDDEESDMDTIYSDENDHQYPDEVETSHAYFVYTEENDHQYPEEAHLFSNLQQEDILSENSQYPATAELTSRITQGMKGAMQIFDTIMVTVSERMFGIEAGPRRSLQISLEDFDPALQPFDDIPESSQRRRTSQISLEEFDITIDEQMA